MARDRHFLISEEADQATSASIAPRPYRNPRSVTDALSELQDCAGSQFDPEVVDALATSTSRHETLVSTPTGRVSPPA